MTWVVFRIFKSSTFVLLIKLCLYPNHVSLMLNVCKQCADRVSNNGSLNTSVCGSLAECHSPQTKMTVCPDVAYSKTCSQKVPGRALVVFLSAYTKQGSGGRTVGPWALKGFSEAAVTGTASWWGGSSQQWCQVSTVKADLYVCVVVHTPFCIATQRKGLWVSTAHRDTQGWRAHLQILNTLWESARLCLRQLLIAINVSSIVGVGTWTM